jgi:hypothetical protein
MTEEDAIFAVTVLVATAWAIAFDIRTGERWPSAGGLFIGLVLGLLVLGDK